MDREIIELAAMQHVPMACIMGFIVFNQFMATVRLAMEQWERRQKRRRAVAPARQRS